jgi:hypothetical protein
VKSSRIAVLIVLGMLSAGLAPPAWAAKPGSGGGGTSGSGVFVKAYSELAGGTQISIAPEDDATTSDGGYVALAASSVSWLVKLSSTGRPAWQRQLGCLSAPPGDYTIGSSIAQTSDGGYVIGGGTIGCGSGSNCPSSSGIQCALVEKISSTGKVEWATVYNAGAASSSAIRKIRVTSDGGFIAVGTTLDSNQDPIGLVLKLDAQGNVQWQRQLGPGPADPYALPNDVQQIADGGYVLTGDLEPIHQGQTLASVLVVKLDASGNVVWQESYNSFDSSGSPTASNNAFSILQTADGGYLVAGNWVNAPNSYSCCHGALLLKLDPVGNVEWQNTLSGGLYYPFYFGATAYTAHQTTDGGYVLTGTETAQSGLGVVPWIAKVNASGSLLWQHTYYQNENGNPLSEDFLSSAAASDGGFLATGYTESAANGDGELYAVKTDSSGLAGSRCTDLQTPIALGSISPSLTEVPPALAVSTAVTPTSNSPATSTSTSIATQSDC